MEEPVFKDEIYLLTSSLTDPNALYKPGYTREFKQRFHNYYHGNPNSSLIEKRDGDKWDEDLVHLLMSRYYELSEGTDEWYKSDMEGAVRIFGLSPMDICDELWGIKETWMSEHSRKARGEIKAYIRYMVSETKKSTKDVADRNKIIKYLKGFLKAEDKGDYVRRTDPSHPGLAFLPDAYVDSYRMWRSTRSLIGFPGNAERAYTRAMEDIVKYTIKN